MSAVSLAKYEYTVANQMYDYCHRVEGKNSWEAMVQLKQRETLFHMEQLYNEFEIASYFDGTGKPMDRGKYSSMWMWSDQVLIPVNVERLSTHTGGRGATLCLYQWEWGQALLEMGPQVVIHSWLSRKLPRGQIQKQGGDIM